jgi:flagellar assembly factor FliW/2-polyprenyl-3-methyl-5-hydroxy-6-metoxy-1,4-benzoquinol methylase
MNKRKQAANTLTPTPATTAGKSAKPSPITLLSFPFGLSGLEDYHDYILHSRPEDKPFFHICAVDNPDLKLLALPADVMADYRPEISAADANFLGLTQAGDAVVLNTLTTQANGQITVNRQAPIVFNRHTLKGKQVLLANAAKYGAQPAPVDPSHKDARKTLGAVGTRQSHPDRAHLADGPFVVPPTIPLPSSTPESSCARARALLNAGEHAKAWEVLNRALRQHPHDPGLLRFKAELLFAQNSLAECVSFVQHLLHRWPDDLRLLELLGECYYFYPEHCKAEGIYRRILTIAPDHELATERHAVLHLANSGNDDPTLPYANIAQAFRRYKYYHVLPLTKHVVTPGVHGFRLIQDLVHRTMDTIDFKNRTVLDIGCRDGLFSFSAEKRGASSVLAIDNDLSKPATEFLIPFYKSKVNMAELNMFDLKPEVHGKFDIIIFAGVLYHLRYPFWALQVLRNVLKPGGTLLLETAIWEGQQGHAMLYCPIGKEGPYESTSVTFFNDKGLRDSLSSLGFSISGARYFAKSHIGIRSSPIGSITRACFVCQYGSAPVDNWTESYWNSLHSGHAAPDPGKIPRVMFGCGFHLNEGAWRWIDEEGEFFVNTSKPEEIHFNLQCSVIEHYPKHPFAVRIYVNDQLASTVTFDSTQQVIPVQIPIHTPATRTCIRIKSECSMVPKEHGLGEDTRNLSVCMSQFEIRPLVAATK